MAQIQSKGEALQQYFNIKNSELTLPPIKAFDSRNMPRRGLKLGKSNSQKQKIIMPGLENKQLSNSTIVRKSKEHKRSSFVKKIKQKINVVLGEMPYSESVELTNYDTDDYDFEAKVNENKAIIKKHKMKKSSDFVHVLSHHKLISEPKPKRKRRQKNEYSLQQSNKGGDDLRILQRPKLSQGQKPSVRTLSYKSNTGSSPSKSKRLLNGTKSKNSKKHLEEKNGYYLPHPKVQSNASKKSKSLFDGIHQFLQNPQLRDQKKHPLTGLSLLRAKQQIQQKYKDLQSQIADLEAYGSQTETFIHKHNIQSRHSAHQWRRVQISHQGVKCEGSTFQKQLDKIRVLQDRSSSKLENYIDNKKILLQFQIRKSNAL